MPAITWCGPQKEHLMSNLKIAADLKRFDLLNLGESIRVLGAQGASELHFDIADGHFITDFGFAPAHIAAAKAMTQLPCHAHLLVREPERCLSDVIASGADVVTLQVETCTHIHRALSLIRDSGKQAGVAVLPATSLTKLNYLFPLMDRLVLICTDPVRRAMGIPRASFERIRILHENIRYHEYAVSLDVEGPLAVEDAARCVRFGASGLVVGPKELGYAAGEMDNSMLQTYREQVSAAVHTV